MLANLCVLDFNKTVIRFYDGKSVKNKVFKNFDEAINYVITSEYKMKSVTENDDMEIYSYWFEK